MNLLLCKQQKPVSRLVSSPHFWLRVTVSIPQHASDKFWTWIREETQLHEESVNSSLPQGATNHPQVSNQIKPHQDCQGSPWTVTQMREIPLFRSHSPNPRRISVAPPNGKGPPVEHPVVLLASKEWPCDVRSSTKSRPRAAAHQHPAQPSEHNPNRSSFQHNLGRVDTNMQSDQWNL